MNKDRRWRCEISFTIEDVDQLDKDDRDELFAFITDALEAWGGQRHPDDWLFGSLEDVRIKHFKQFRRSNADLARERKAKPEAPRDLP